ncbi:helix-turn-helix domain-containing protein [Arenimonas sp. MALMAid1274]|uniref:helix-turn-helix domain-containing protein n=1 Tax=Arenimonas sp. MALMAid1274 TaxID=3411630 RepID=UPI003BA00E10
MSVMPSAKPTKTIFGSRLRAAREDRGWTQGKLGAVALGIEDENNGASRISRYEGGDRLPDPETLQALADALGMPAVYFHATNDLMADIILQVSKLPQKSQRQVLEHIKGLAAKRTPG